jgi:hypothetical protein
MVMLVLSVRTTSVVFRSRREQQQVVLLRSVKYLLQLQILISKFVKYLSEVQSVRPPNNPTHLTDWWWPAGGWLDGGGHDHDHGP